MSDISALEFLQLLNVPGLPSIDPDLVVQTVTALQAQQAAQSSQQPVGDALKTSAAQPKATWSNEEEKFLAILKLQEMHRKRKWEAVENPSKTGGQTQSANVSLPAV